MTLDRERNARVLRARALRREMTLPEVRLWQELRKRPAGFKFRRQHPIGLFVLDFYCAAAKLVIEIDGEAHGLGTNPQQDRRRDEWLSSGGLTILRIPARDVLADRVSVITQIVTACRS